MAVVTYAIDLSMIDTLRRLPRLSRMAIDARIRRIDMLRGLSDPRVVVVASKTVVQTSYLRMIDGNRRNPRYGRVTRDAHIGCCDMGRGFIRPCTAREMARYALAIYLIVVDDNSVLPNGWGNRVATVALVGCGNMIGRFAARRSAVVAF